MHKIESWNNAIIYLIRDSKISFIAATMWAIEQSNSMLLSSWENGSREGKKESVFFFLLYVSYYDNQI